MEDKPIWFDDVIEKGKEMGREEILEKVEKIALKQIDFLCYLSGYTLIENKGLSLRINLEIEDLKQSLQKLKEKK
jgi:hypothetical protein